MPMTLAVQLRPRTDVPSNMPGVNVGFPITGPPGDQEFATTCEAVSTVDSPIRVAVPLPRPVLSWPTRTHGALVVE